MSRWQVDLLAGKVPVVMLVLARVNHGTGGFTLTVFRPNTGRAMAPIARARLRREFTRVTDDAACWPHWDALRAFYRDHCGHRGCRRSNCRFKSSRSSLHLVTGNILPHWEGIKDAAREEPRLVRVTPSCGAAPLLGVRVPPGRLQAVCAALRQGGPLSGKFVLDALRPRLQVFVQACCRVRALARKLTAWTWTGEPALHPPRRGRAGRADVRERAAPRRAHVPAPAGVARRRAAVRSRGVPDAAALWP
ncbi:MAG: hypothetical protein CMI16_13015 [Opitutaceae bacterium]|nr:hypothetical protein [Opitutaceae bacterium]